MQQNVKQLLKHQDFIKAEILTNTLGGMPVPLLTITENCESYISYADQWSLQNELTPSLKK